MSTTLAWQLSELVMFWQLTLHPQHQSCCAVVFLHSCNPCHRFVMNWVWKNIKTDGLVVFIKTDGLVVFIKTVFIKTDGLVVFIKTDGLVVFHRWNTLIRQSLQATQLTAISCQRSGNIFLPLPCPTGPITTRKVCNVKECNVLTVTVTPTVTPKGTVQKQCGQQNIYTTYSTMNPIISINYINTLLRCSTLFNIFPIDLYHFQHTHTHTHSYTYKHTHYYFLKTDFTKIWTCVAGVRDQSANRYTMELLRQTGTPLNLHHLQCAWQTRLGCLFKNLQYYCNCVNKQKRCCPYYRALQSILVPLG